MCSRILGIRASVWMCVVSERWSRKPGIVCKLNFVSAERQHPRECRGRARLCARLLSKRVGDRDGIELFAEDPITGVFSDSQFM